MFADSSTTGYRTPNVDSGLSYNPLTNTLSATTFSGTLSGNSSGITGYSGTYWTSNNDGAASGLDADLLDGQQGTYYLNTSATTQTKTGDLNLTNLKVSGSLYDKNTSAGSTGFVLKSTATGVEWVDPTTVAGLQGTQGIQGTTGPQGIQGTTGSQGTTGTQGIQGITGSQGIQGTTGSQGIQGTIGTQGTQGIQGITGSQGTTGTQGTQGIQGTTGSQGTTGTQGIQGTTGSQGTTGTQGIQGTTGSQGTTGTQGTQGTQGRQGIQGTTGSQGTTGTQGTQGIIGPVGGSANQVVYKDGSNNPTGSNNLTFNGTQLYVNEITGPASLVIDPTTIGDDTGTVVIKGDLQIDGTTTTVNSTTVTIDDKNIVLASGSANAAAADGGGITIDGASATLIYASTGDKWVFNKAPYYNADRLLTTADEGSGNGLDADTLDSLNSTSFFRADAGNTVDARFASADGRGVRFYDADSYKIYMSSTGNATWGGRLDSTSDFNMYFRMTGGTNRGFVFQNGTTELFQIESNGQLRVASNNIYAGNANIVWHAGNDGSGSGLDADTVDGIQASSFLRSDAADTGSGLITLTNGLNVTGGNVGIGTNNATEKLDVIGTVKATDFNTTSDQNLKDNIRTIENPLDKISKIRGVSFEWKDTKKLSAGVIAQEVEKVLPELVNGKETRTVNYNGLIGLLIETVKEQQNQINILSEKISRFE
jgi:hypothetical protein